MVRPRSDKENGDRINQIIGRMLDAAKILSDMDAAITAMAKPAVAS